MSMTTKIDDAATGTMILYDSPRGFANERTTYVFDAANPAQRQLANRMLARYRDREPGTGRVMYAEGIDEHERRVYGRRLSARLRSEKYLPIDAVEDDDTDF